MTEELKEVGTQLRRAMECILGFVEAGKAQPEHLAELHKLFTLQIESSKTTETDVILKEIQARIQKIERDLASLRNAQGLVKQQPLQGTRRLG